jgi:hypothetical protein
MNPFRIQSVDGVYPLLEPQDGPSRCGVWVSLFALTSLELKIDIKLGSNQCQLHEMLSTSYITHSNRNSAVRYSWTCIDPPASGSATEMVPKFHPRS